MDNETGIPLRHKPKASSKILNRIFHENIWIEFQIDKQRNN